MNCKSCKGLVVKVTDTVVKCQADCGCFEIDADGSWQPCEEPQVCVTDEDSAADGSALQQNEESAILDEKQTLSPDLDEDSNLTVTQEPPADDEGRKIDLGVCTVTFDDSEE